MKERIVDSLLLYRDLVIRPRALFESVNDRAYWWPSLVLILATSLVGALKDRLIEDNMLGSVIVADIVMRFSLAFVGVAFLASLFNWLGSYFRKSDEWGRLRNALPFTMIPSILITVIAIIGDAAVITTIGQYVELICGLLLSVIMITSIKKISYLQAVLVNIFAVLLFAIPVGLIMLAWYLLR